MSDLRGKYRNHLGVEMEVVEPASTMFHVLGDDIFIGRISDSMFFGASEYLVTEKSLADSGYERVDGEPTDG